MKFTFIHLSFLNDVVAVPSGQCQRVLCSAEKDNDSPFASLPLIIQKLSPRRPDGSVG